MIDIRLIAYCAAGDAVAAIIGGYKLFPKVQIFEEPQDDHGELTGVRYVKRDIAAEANACMAGACAEWEAAKLLGVEPNDADSMAESIEELQTLIQERGFDANDGNFDHRIEFWTQAAKEFVIANWDAIDALAQRLIEKRALPSKEVRVLVRDTIAARTQSQSVTHYAPANSR